MLLVDRKQPSWRANCTLSAGNKVAIGQTPNYLESSQLRHPEDYPESQNTNSGTVNGATEAHRTPVDHETGTHQEPDNKQLAQIPQLPPIPSSSQVFTAETDPFRKLLQPNTSAIAELEQKIAENREKIADLLKQVDQLDQVIVERSRYGYTDTNGDFRRMVPEHEGGVVTEVAPGYAVMQFMKTDEDGGSQTIDTAAVARFLGVDTDSLTEQQRNDKIAELATHEKALPQRPHGVSVKVDYQNDLGQTESYYIPLHMIQFDRSTTSISGNTSTGIATGFVQTTPIHRDANSSTTLSYGGTVGVSSEVFGVTAGADITRDSIDPKDLSRDRTQYGARIGFNGGPFVAARYSTRSYDPLNQEITSTSVSLGTSPIAPIFGSASFDTGNTEISLHLNQIPVIDMPLVGAWGLTATIEGSPSYWAIDPSLQYLDTQAGTDREDVLTAGIAGWGGIGVPFIIPGPGISPTRRWTLPENIQQGLQLTRASQSMLARHEKVTSELEQETQGRVTRLSSRISQANNEYFEVAGTDLVLPEASYAVHLLPVRELTTGRYNTIVANAEQRLDIDIVDDNGNLVRSGAETQRLIDERMREHLYELNPALHALSERTQNLIQEYAGMAVQAQQIPSTDKLREMGANSTSRIPHVDSFEIEVDTSMEITADAKGRNVIAGQIALNLRIPTNYEEYMYGDRPVSLEYDTETLYLQRAVVIDEKRPLEEQLQEFRENVERGANQVVNISYTEMATASNRNQDVELARERVVNHLTLGGNPQAIASHWQTTHNSRQNWRELLKEINNTDTQAVVRP